MSSMFTKQFIYNGIHSSEYGLFFGHIQTEKLKQVLGKVNYSTAYYRSQYRHVISDQNYEDAPLSFEIEIISAAPINEARARKIQQWLFNAQDYQRLYAGSGAGRRVEKINGEEKRVYVECVFYNPEELRYADGLHGWRCTCNLSSALAFQDEITLTFTDFTEPILIRTESDAQEYIYPTLVINTGNQTNPMDVSVRNTNDANRAMLLKGIPAQTVIYADCIAGTVTDNTYGSLYAHLTDQKFLRLLPGENHLVVTGADSLQITWQNLRYIL